MRRAPQLRRVPAGAAAIGVAALLAGCSVLADAGHAVAGHWDLLRRARPVDAWLQDASTPPELAERLRLAQRLRTFAVQVLHLPDGASYRRYADLGRDAVVWNVVAAPALSLEPHRWCWPVVGCTDYHGHFEQARAEREAAALRAAGWEAIVYGVTAYSTLGRTEWLGGDPLLNTFMRGDAAQLAGLMFHEMAHQRVYAAGDSMFNESYATAVERLGLAAWRAADPTRGAAAAQPAAPERARWRAEVQATRATLSALYASGMSDAEKQAGKQRIYAALRAAARATTSDGAGSDEAARRIAWADAANNATFAIAATYDQWVPAFEALFRREGRDFARFHAAAGRLASLPPADREAALRALAPPAAAEPAAASAPPAASAIATDTLRR